MFRQDRPAQGVMRIGVPGRTMEFRKRALHKVAVLPDATPAAPVDVSEATDVDALRAAWQGADADTRKAIEARVTELTKEPSDG